MAERFMPVEDLSKRLILFKDTWYSIVDNAEKLSNYRSGFDGGFKKRLKGIKSDLEKCRSGLEEMNLHLKHHFPKLRVEIDKGTVEVLAGLKDFAIFVEKDLGDLATSAELEAEMGELQKRLEEVEKDYRKAEMRANEACGKYFETKSNYSIDLKKVKRLSKKNVENVLKRYSKDIKPLMEGCDMVLGEEVVGIEGLFERLYEEPNRAENVELIPKGKERGLLSPLASRKKREASLKPRLSVLRYVLHEAAKELVKIIEEEGKNLSKVKAKYSDFDALEKACTELDEERKKLEGPRKALWEKREKLKKEPAMRFSEYDGVLGAQEEYLKRFEELNKKVKPYLSIVGDALEGYESFETDVEKRELMEEIRKLKKEAKKYREKLSELKELHEELKKKHEEALGGLKKVI